MSSFQMISPVLAAVASSRFTHPEAAATITKVAVSNLNFPSLVIQVLLSLTNSKVSDWLQGMERY